MNLKNTIKLLNRRRNYALKRLKIKLKYHVPVWYINTFKHQKQPVDLSKIKKVLVVRNDLIGDMVMTTPLLKHLAEHGLEVYVASKSHALSMLVGNPHVKGCFHYDDASWKTWLSSLKHAQAHEFDCVIDMKLSTSTASLLFCAHLKTKILIGFNKSNVKSYHHSIAYRHPESHITQSFLPLYELFGMPVNEATEYEVFVQDSVRLKTAQFLNNLVVSSNLTNRLIVLNPYGSKAERGLSQTQINAIFEMFANDTIVLIGEHKKISQIQLANHAVIFPSKSVLDILAILEKADLVLTVDTAVVHIAAALQRPTVAIYKDTPPLQNQSNELNDDALKQYKRECHLLSQDGPYIRQYNVCMQKHIQSKLYAPNHAHAVQLVYVNERIDDIEHGILIKDIANALAQLSTVSFK